MKCPTCQTENSSGNRSCNKCGSPLEVDSATTLSCLPVQSAASGVNLRFNPGEKFGDRYTIIEEIGEGGMGRIYKAKDHELGITVVLKMIRPELLSRPGVIDQFKKELLLGRSVSQENVVRIHDLGEVQKVRYISMDFIKGENLLDFLKTSGTLTLSTCYQIAIQICRALKVAHQNGVIHQDIKPQNIMINNSGKVYVTDFGLAKSISRSTAPQAGMISGTPKYFSPEQARGEESDQRSDIYSFGAVLYEMVTGTPPFKADTVGGYMRKHCFEKPFPPSNLNPGLPPACDKIILKCLEKKKEDRYQSVDELLQDLEAEKTQILGPVAKGRLKKWQISLMIAALILVAGAVISGFFRGAFTPSSRARPPGRISIAIMYAVNNTGDKSLDDSFRWVIPYYLGQNLSQSKFLRVLPQDRLMQVLSDMKQLDEEHHLSRTLDRISEAANIDYFVLPSFMKAGDSLWISFTVRRAKSDETVGVPDTVRGQKLENVLAMVDELSAKIKSRLNFSAAEIAGDTGQDLGRITTTSPEAVRYFVDAEKYYLQENYRSGIQALEKAINVDPNYAMAYMKMAVDYGYLDETTKARKYLQKALSLVDRVSERDRYHIQAYAALALNDSPLQAIGILQKIIRLYPDEDSGYTLLGATYRNLEEWGLALNQFEKVLTINPRDEISLANKIYILTAMGRYKEAADLTRANATESFINQSFILRQLPLLDLIQGQYGRASAQLEKTLARMPDNSSLIELKGIYYLLSGDLASARHVLEELQQRGEADPNAIDLQGRYQLANLDLLQGEYHQAQEQISAGIELAQKSGQIFTERRFRLLLAYSELRLQRFSRVADALKPASETGQDLGLHFLGMASLGLGRIQEAKQISLKLRERSEITRQTGIERQYEYLMGQIALTERSPDQAVSHFNKAISLLPHQMETFDEQAFYYDGLAAVYYRSGQWTEAGETYQNIVALTTGRLQWCDVYARSYYWLGKINQRTGNNREARSHYERFLELWQNADDEMPEIADAKKQLMALKKSP
jgi:serine/threonine protein kinase/tetratricopeptide (TPR) repeat protein